MSEAPETEEEINEELTKAYIGGLFDGSGTITARIHKDSDYKFGYAMEVEVSMSRVRPHSIQIIDEWTIENGIKASVNRYDDQYQIRIGRVSDVERFLEQIAPYMYDRYESVQLLLEEIIPKIREKYYSENRENFIEMVDLLDKLRQYNSKARGKSKYTREYFEDEWSDYFEDSS